MKKSFRLFLTFLFVITLSIIAKTSTYAIPISPDKYFININIGETQEKELTIMGRQEMTAPVTLYLRAVGMKKIGEEHERDFYIQDPNDKSEPANWITLSKTKVVVHPGETVTVPWSITPLSEAQCGTNLAAILISNNDYSKENEDSTEVKLNKEVASQVHITINNNGECNNEFHLQLMDFQVVKQKILGLFKLPIYNYNNAKFETRIANDGNIIARSPMGFITVAGPNIDRAQLPLNKEHYDIYPNTIRRFTTIWHDDKYPDKGNFFQKLFYEIFHWRFGKYSATLGVTKNTDTNIISTVTFLIIPWRPFVTLFVLIALTIIYFKSKKQNEKKK